MDIINWGRGKFNVPAFSARKKDGEYAGGISIDPLSPPSALIFLAFYSRCSKEFKHELSISREK